MDAGDETRHDRAIRRGQEVSRPQNVTTEARQGGAIARNCEHRFHVLEAGVEQDLFLGIPPPVDRRAADTGSFGDFMRTDRLNAFSSQQPVSGFQNVLSGLIASRPTGSRGFCGFL
jgi:hypothetical protein